MIPCAVGSAMVGLLLPMVAAMPPCPYTEVTVVKWLASWNSGNTCANMHQSASVLARFWIQPPAREPARIADSKSDATAIRMLIATMINEKPFTPLLFP